MAIEKSPLRRGERAGQGLKTSDRGTVIPLEGRAPSHPEFLHMSKAQVLEVLRKEKEKALEMEKFSREYDERKKEVAPPPPEAPKAEKPEKPKSKKKK